MSDLESKCTTLNIAMIAQNAGNQRDMTDIRGVLSVRVVGRGWMRRNELDTPSNSPAYPRYMAQDDLDKYNRRAGEEDKHEQ